MSFLRSFTFFRLAIVHVMRPALFSVYSTFPIKGRLPFVTIIVDDIRFAIYFVFVVSRLFDRGNIDNTVLAM